MHTYICMHMNVHMYVCMRVCMYIYVCMHACMHVCMHLCMYVCVYVYLMGLCNKLHRVSLQLRQDPSQVPFLDLFFLLMETE